MTLSGRKQVMAHNNKFKDINNSRKYVKNITTKDTKSTKEKKK